MLTRREFNTLGALSLLAIYLEQQMVWSNQAATSLVFPPGATSGERIEIQGDGIYAYNANGHLIMAITNRDPASLDHSNAPFIFYTGNGGSVFPTGNALIQNGTPAQQNNGLPAFEYVDNQGKYFNGPRYSNAGAGSINASLSLSNDYNNIVLAQIGSYVADSTRIVITSNAEFYFADMNAQPLNPGLAIINAINTGQVGNTQYSYSTGFLYLYGSRVDQSSGLIAQLSGTTVTGGKAMPTGTGTVQVFNSPKSSTGLLASLNSDNVAGNYNMKAVLNNNDGIGLRVDKSNNDQILRYQFGNGGVGAYYNETVACNGVGVPNATFTQLTLFNLVSSQNDYSGAQWNLNTGVWTCPETASYFLNFYLHLSANVNGRIILLMYDAAGNTIRAQDVTCPGAQVNLGAVVPLTKNTQYHFTVYQVSGSSKTTAADTQITIARML